MITSLRLIRFSRFAGSDIDVELAKTTLFVGGNGSGKTTFFDALTAAVLDAACANGAPTTSLSRYGGEAAAVIATDSEIHVSLADYWAMHAAPEGRIDFVAAAWGARSDLDARLRGRSVDLAAMVGVLADRVSGDAAAEQTSELDAIRQRLGELEERCQDAALRRRELMAVEACVHRLTREIVEVERSHLDLQAELQRVGDELAREMQRRGVLLENRREETRLQRREIGEQLDGITVHRADVTALAELGPLDADDQAQFEALVAEVESFRAKLESIRKRRACCDTRLRAAVDEIAEARAAVPLQKRAAARAASMKIRLNRFVANPAMVERRTWRGGPVVAACAFFAGGLVVATTIRELAPYLGLGVGMTLGTFSLALGRRTVREAAPGAEALLVRQLRETWNVDSELPSLSATSAREALAFCNDQIRSYSRLTARLEERAGYKCGVEEDLGRVLDHSSSALETSLAARRAALDEWLAGKNIEDAETFRAKIASQTELEARIAARPQAASLPDTPGVCDELTAELRCRLDALNHRATDDRVPECDERIGAWIESQARLQAGCDEHDREGIEAAARRAELTARVDAERPRLTEEIVSLVAERRRLKRASADLELDGRAARRAQELVACLLASETPSHLRPVAEAMTSLLEACGTPVVRLELAGLDEEALCIEVAGGAMRPVAELSSGWRSFMLLAARLALALVLGDPTLPLLVLEEPFAGLDQERTACGVRMIAEFQRRRGWQVFLMTRDERLASACAQQLEDVRVVDLSSLG